MDAQKLKEIVDAAIQLARNSSGGSHEIAAPVASALIYVALKDVHSRDVQEALVPEDTQ